MTMFLPPLSICFLSMVGSDLSLFLPLIASILLFICSWIVICDVISFLGWLARASLVIIDHGCRRLMILSYMSMILLFRSLCVRWCSGGGGGSGGGDSGGSSINGRILFTKSLFPSSAAANTAAPGSIISSTIVISIVAVLLTLLLAAVAVVVVVIVDGGHGGICVVGPVIIFLSAMV